MTQTSLRVKSLKQGKVITYKISDGGDLASMRGIFKHGQELTLFPVMDFYEVKVGDIVYVQWRGGNYILHVVQEVCGDQFLIANSLGKINGWVHGSAILGKVTHLSDPDPHPGVPEMLKVLQTAYQTYVQSSDTTADEALRLETIVQDLHWYMERIGPERWTKLPKQNRWNFESNLWYVTKKACAAAQDPLSRPVAYYIDQGKWVVGFAAELIALFEEYDWEYLS